MRFYSASSSNSVVEFDDVDDVAKPMNKRMEILLFSGRSVIRHHGGCYVAGWILDPVVVVEMSWQARGLVSFMFILLPQSQRVKKYPARMFVLFGNQ